MIYTEVYQTQIEFVFDYLVAALIEYNSQLAQWNFTLAVQYLAYHFLFVWLYLKELQQEYVI